MLAVIRIKGRTRLSPDARKSLELLKLDRLYTLALVEETPSLKGIVRRAKDYVTWGEVSDKALKELKKLDLKGDKVQFVHMHPPRGGFRKSVKKQKPIGELGYRGELINKLILRMLPE